MRIVVSVLLLAALVHAREEQIIAVVVKVLPDGSAVVDRGAKDGVVGATEPDTHIVRMGQPSVGSRVALQANIPDGRFHSVFWPLARAHAELLDAGGRPLFTYRKLRRGITAQEEAAILELLADSVRAFADQNAYYIRGDHGFRALTEGRFMNRTPHQAMLGANDRDARNFVRYLNEQVLPTLAGRRSQVGLVYGVWVGDGGPPSLEEMVDDLVRAPDWPARRATVRHYRKHAERLAPALLDLARRDAARAELFRSRADVAAIVSADHPMAEQYITAVVTKTVPPFVELDRGGVDGIIEGWGGSLIPARTVQPVSGARIESVTEYTARARVLQQGVPVKVGDIVVLPARRPVLPDRSVLSYLARYHIDILDRSGRPFVAARTVIVGDTPDLQRRVFGAMLAELDGVTATELETFLYSMVQRRVHYGLGYRLAETFARWVELGRPREDPDTVPRIIERVMLEMDARRVDRALAELDVAARVAKPAEIWFVDSARARVLFEAERYDDALRVIETAMPKTRGGERGRLLALKGLALEQLDRPNEAFAALREASQVADMPFQPRVEMLLGAGRLLGDAQPLRTAIEVSKQLMNRWGFGDAHLALANLESDKKKAFEHIQQAYGEFTRTDNRRGQADALELSASIETPDTARARLYAALSLRREIGDPIPLARTLYNIGWLAINRIDALSMRAAQQTAPDMTLNTAIAAALQEWGLMLEESVAIQRKLPASPLLAESLLSLATYYKESGQHDRAFPGYREAIERGDDEVKRRSYRNLIELREKRGEYQLALEAGNSYVAIAGPELSTALVVRALMHLSLGQPDAARIDLERSAELRRQANDADGESEARALLCRALRMLKRFDAAEAQGKAALALGLQAKSEHRRIVAQVQLGVLYTDRGDVAAARKAFYAAYGVADDEGVAQALIEDASALRAAGAYDNALLTCDLLLRFTRAAHAHRATARTLILKSELLRARGELLEARDVLAEAKPLELDPMTRAQLTHATAVVVLDMGDGARAIELLTQALRGGADVAAVRRDRARAHRLQGDLVRADADLLIAEKAMPDPDSPLLWERARLYLAKGDVSSALPYFTKAVERSRDPAFMSETALVMLEAFTAKYRGDLQQLAPMKQVLWGATVAARQQGTKLSEARLLVATGQYALAMNQPDEAVRQYKGALALYDELGVPHLRWAALYGLSRVEDELGQLGPAVQHRREAVQILDALVTAAGDPDAQKNFLRSKIEVYESFAELLGRLAEQTADPKRRRDLIEESQLFVSRARFEIIRKSTLRAADTPAMRRYREKQRERALQREALDRALDRGDRGRAERYKQLLAQTDRDLYATFLKIKAKDRDLDRRLKFIPHKLGDAAQELPADATLVAYFPGQERLFIWVYQRDREPRWLSSKIGKDALNKLIDEYRKLAIEVKDKAKENAKPGRGFGPAAEADPNNPPWYVANIKALRKNASTLYNHLLANVPGVADAKPLVILPYGRLSYLPFESLIDEKGKFFGEDHRVVYVTSRDHFRDNLLESLRTAATRGADHWVGFVNLKSAVEEADTIGKLFGQRTVHSFEDARKGRVEALPTACTILHFATHGHLNGVDPSQTALALFRESLSQSDVYGLKFTNGFKARAAPRLVVLSACSTALAHDDPEAEVLGMPSAFNDAGAPSVIASLWDVYTYSTSAMMEEFYKRYVTQKLDKAAALQGARKHLIHARNGRYAHPYFWAPFLLFGDWR